MLQYSCFTDVCVALTADCSSAASHHRRVDAAHDVRVCKGSNDANTLDLAPHRTLEVESGESAVASCVLIVMLSEL